MRYKLFALLLAMSLAVGVLPVPVQAEYASASARAEVSDEEKNRAAAQEVIDLINAIGEVTYTPECDKKIKAAQKAYLELKKEQRALVTNIDKWEEANVVYHQLEMEHREELAKVLPLIRRLAALNPIQLSKKEELVKIRTDYNALKPFAQEYAKNYHGTNFVAMLEKAEAELQELESAEAAKAVENLIAKLGPVANTQACGNAIAAARKAYQDLDAVAQKKVSAEAVTKLEKAEQELASLQAKEAEKLIDAIGEVTYTDACKKKIDAALEAYQKLTPAAIAMLPAEKLAAMKAAEKAWRDAADSEEQADAAAKALAEKLDKLGTVTLEKGETIRQLRREYDGLSTLAQTKLKELNGKQYVALLEAAEKTLAELEEKASYQIPPLPPMEEAKTGNSITLVTIPVNSNGARVQYSMNGGVSWQYSPIFTGLTPNTSYSFVARYDAVGNKKASESSKAQTITTTAAQEVRPQPQQPVPGWDPYEDGSSSQTTVTPEGTLVETIQLSDGTMRTTEQRRNGSTSEISGTPTGSTGMVVTDASGRVVEAAVKISPKSVAAVPYKAPVRLPVRLPVGSSKQFASSLRVEIPAGGAKLELPLRYATPGTVVSLTHGDGTEKLLKKVKSTGYSLIFQLNASGTLKVYNNSKYFWDVPAGHWAAGAIEFVTSRELFNGTGNGAFSPTVPTTRGQLMTALARLDGADTSGNAIRKGMDWAKAHGISDGTNPAGTMSRQQLATMLWRYAGSPHSDYVIQGRDGWAIAEYARPAMAWAMESGILSGYGDGSLKPEGTASRAHVAAMVQRYCTALAEND